MAALRLEARDHVASFAERCGYLAGARRGAVRRVAPRRRRSSRGSARRTRRTRRRDARTAGAGADLFHAVASRARVTQDRRGWCVGSARVQDGGGRRDRATRRSSSCSSFRRVAELRLRTSSEPRRRPSGGSSGVRPRWRTYSREGRDCWGSSTCSDSSPRATRDWERWRVTQRLRSRWRLVNAFRANVRIRHLECTNTPPHTPPRTPTVRRPPFALRRRTFRRRTFRRRTFRRLAPHFPAAHPAMTSLYSLAARGREVREFAAAHTSSGGIPRS